MTSRITLFRGDPSLNKQITSFCEENDGNNRVTRYRRKLRHKLIPRRPILVLLPSEHSGSGENLASPRASRAEPSAAGSGHREEPVSIGFHEGFPAIFRRLSYTRGCRRHWHRAREGVSNAPEDSCAYLGNAMRNSLRHESSGCRDPLRLNYSIICAALENISVENSKFAVSEVIEKKIDLSVESLSGAVAAVRKISEACAMPSSKPVR